MTRLSRELKQLVYDRDTAENEVAALQVMTAYKIVSILSGLGILQG